MHKLTVVEQSRLWDNLPGETSDDFKRFECFRRLPGKRSLLAAYTAYLVLTHGQVEVDRRKSAKPYAITCAPPNWPVIAEDYHWVERAEAWDMHQHQLDITVEQEEIDQCRSLRREALHSLLTTSIQSLANFDADTATLSQIAQAVKVAVSQLRIEYGDNEQFQLEALLSFLDPTTRGAIVLALRATPLTLLPPDTDAIIDAE